MPSLSHETLLLLFRNRPELAPELMREVLGVELPTYAEARIESAELTDVSRPNTAPTWSCCSTMGSRSAELFAFAIPSVTFRVHGERVRSVRVSPDAVCV